MSDRLTAVLRLFGAGLYRDALTWLDTTRRHPEPQPADVDVLTADILQRVGRTETAREIARTYADAKRCSLQVRARAHLVLGNEHRETGKSGEAVSHYQKALDLADEAADSELACWSQLRLLLAFGESDRRSLTPTFLLQLRQRVSRLGDPQVSAALHLFVAQLEARTGALDNARQHVDIGRSLLAKSSNIWLEGIACIDASCICYLKSNYSEALGEARHALDCAHRSGHAAILRAALANLGHLYLVQMKLGRADACLRQALSISPGGERRIGIIDGLAQVMLAAGRLNDAGQIVRSIRDEHRTAISGEYYSGWTALTALKLSIRLVPGEAAPIFRRPDSLGNLTDPWLLQLVKLAQAEACARRSSSTQAIALLQDVVRADEGRAADLIPRLGRVIARMYANEGNNRLAAEWFERSERIAGLSGDQNCRNEAIVDHAEWLYDMIRRDGNASNHGDIETRYASRLRTTRCVQVPASRITYHPNATSVAEYDVPCHGASSSVLDCVRSAVHLSGSPLAFGAELFEMLHQHGAVTCGALLECGSQGAPKIVRSWGDYRSVLNAVATGTRTAPLIGRWQHKDIKLVAEGASGLPFQCAHETATALAALALKTQKMEGNERNAVSLWPDDNYIEQHQAIFASQSMKTVLATARRIAASTITVLLTGETGTGKEVLARVLHDASPRSDGPFVPFNCTAVPRDMVDSQLFGYRRGAFTGALEHFPGVVRSASAGTLFLDEVGEIPPDIQPKLLRFLDVQEIHPLGEPHPLTVDVRVVAATNANLEELVAAGRFREDLFYRLNVVRLHLPPLRERRDEIPILVHRYLERFAAEYEKDELRIAEEAMEHLMLYSWPGNIRELVNVIRRLAALADKRAVLLPEHLPQHITSTRRTEPRSDSEHSKPAESMRPSHNEVAVRLDQPLSFAVQQLERSIIPYAMRAAEGHMELAARMLGLSRKGLYLKRQRLGLDDELAAAPPVPEDIEEQA